MLKRELKLFSSPNLLNYAIHSFLGKDNERMALSNCPFLLLNQLKSSLKPNTVYSPDIDSFDNFKPFIGEQYYKSILNIVNTHNKSVLEGRLN